MATKLDDALEAALAAAKHVGHVSPSDTVSDFSPKRCRALVEAGGQTCPIHSNDLSDTVQAFCERMRDLLSGTYENPDIPVVDLCASKGGTPFTWRDWCRLTAQNLRLREGA